MKIIEQLEELVIRLEDLKKQQNLTRDFVTQQLDEINSKILPELDAELLRVNDKAYKNGEPSKEIQDTLDRIDDLFIKVDSLVSTIQSKYEIITVNDEFDDGLERSVYDDENFDEEGGDEEIEFLFNEVAKSALRTIGDKDNDPQTISVMGDILALLASGEKNDDIIVGKVLAPIVVSGYYVESDALKNMCAKTRKLCGKQILGLQIAMSSISEYKCSAYDALSQIDMFLP